jgi:hypothetical protein
MAPMGLSGASGKLIHERNLRSKIVFVRFPLKCTIIEKNLSKSVNG